MLLVVECDALPNTEIKIKKKSWKENVIDYRILIKPRRNISFAELQQLSFKSVNIFSSGNFNANICIKCRKAESIALIWRVLLMNHTIWPLSVSVGHEYS